MRPHLSLDNYYMLTEVAIVYHQGPINKPCPNQALFFHRKQKLDYQKTGWLGIRIMCQTFLTHKFTTAHFSDLLQEL
jgi:hypothetical protein